MAVIDLGGSTVFATQMVEEAYGRLHYAVRMERYGKGSGLNMGLGPLFHPAWVYAAVEKAGLRFTGPAPLDTDAGCMRFMFEADAKAFFDAFQMETEL